MSKKQITLDDLEKRKQRLLNKIDLQEKEIGKTWRQTFRPVKEAISFTDRMAYGLKSVVSLYQGAMWGYRIVRFFGGGRNKKRC
ncbi:MAG: hypothetical protein GX416_08115 [Bacteroidales bacterium]|jgi:hypothetical protein|nr:hypothetical protein [Bacteroidales bacterium]